jgi:hypothetical protein
VNLVPIPDFAGDNAVHTIAQIMTLQGVAVPSPPRAVMLVFREITAGTTNSRIGDATVSTTRGIPFSSTDSLVLPALGGPSWYLNQPTYDLTKIFVFAANGDTLAIAIGVW